DPGNGGSAAQRGLLARFHASFCPSTEPRHSQRAHTTGDPTGFWSMSMTGNVTMRSLPPAVPRRSKPLRRRDSPCVRPGPIHGFLQIVTDVPNNHATNEISPHVRIFLTVVDALFPHRIAPNHANHLLITRAPDHRNARAGFRSRSPAHIMGTSPHARHACWAC